MKQDVTIRHQSGLRNSGLTQSQKRYIEALLAGRSHHDAQEHAGVTGVTMSRWRKDEMFTNAVRKAAATLLGVHGLVVAQKRILAILEDDSASTRMHLDAAKMVLDVFKDDRKGGKFDMDDGEMSDAALAQSRQLIEAELARRSAERPQMRDVTPVSNDDVIDLL